MTALCRPSVPDPISTSTTMHWQVTTAPQHALPRARRSRKAANLDACGKRRIRRSTPSLRGRPGGRRHVEGAFATLAPPKFPLKKGKCKKRMSFCVDFGVMSPLASIWDGMAWRGAATPCKRGAAGKLWGTGPFDHPGAVGCRGHFDHPGAVGCRVPNWPGMPEGASGSVLLSPIWSSWTHPWLGRTRPRMGFNSPKTGPTGPCGHSETWGAPTSGSQMYHRTIRLLEEFWPPENGQIVNVLI